MPVLMSWNNRPMSPIPVVFLSRRFKLRVPPPIPISPYLPIFCRSIAYVESGWPSEGQTLGDAVPSESNKYTAVRSIISALGGQVIVFEAFNDYWKAPGPEGVENSFVSSSP